MERLKKHLRSSLNNVDPYFSRVATALIVAAVALALVGCQDKQAKKDDGNGTAQGIDTGCKCVEISLLFPSDQLGADGKKPALGPKDDSSEGWPVGDGTSYHGDLDGKTVGPLAKNPGNPQAINGRANIGYGFEVRCTVQGTPGACKEIQLVKGTTTHQGKPDQPKRWTGKKADTSLDGAPSIDVSTKDKCDAAKGHWDATTEMCTLEFPQSGEKYGPDARVDTELGAYEHEFTYKKHVGKTIIWFDAPMFGRDAASSKDADFIAMVRGTDNKYCYVKFKVHLKRRMKASEKDVEELTVTERGNQVHKVPGIP